MNGFDDQHLFHRLLRLLAEESETSQREMARRMGISLGKLNYCVSQLAERGWIKMKRFAGSKRKAAYFYILTPQGLEAKARLTVQFLRRRMNEYEELRREIREPSGDVERLRGDLEGSDELLEEARRIV